MNKKLTVLAVDDDIINLKLIKTMLKNSGNISEVIEAKNGLEALNILKVVDKINLILLDIKMPIMNGIEFMKNISSIPTKRNIPIIILTTDESMKHESFDHGAFDFIVKPIRKDDLYEKIARVNTLI